MSNPRVLKEHKQAVVDVLGPGTVAAVAAVLSRTAEQLCTDIAAGVLGAYDGTTRYVVLVREPQDAGLTVYGPYASGESAQKALDEGHAHALVNDGALARIYPLTPAPKAARKKKSGSTA